MGPLSLQPAKTATREELKHSGVKVLLIGGLCSHGSFVQDVWQPILAIFYLAQCKQRIFFKLTTLLKNAIQSITK